ncbi:MAG: DNA-processing protein DprA [Bacteroidota bacterium]|nr:DNA-processing protein DprA [Bacteroidota bacterium]
MCFDERIYQVALCMLPGIGPVSAKRLVSHCGTAGEVFRQKKSHLLKIPHIGEATANALRNKEVMLRAEQELKFAEKKDIRILFYLDADYPARLKQCYDSPAVLFFRGNSSLDQKRIVSIVGTRKITPYGEALTEKLLQDFADKNILIVSGLAYGVDITAHRAALNSGLETVGVLAHGLDLVYPSAHTSTAKKMMEQGGLLTDFPSGTTPDKENFPMRNRIVAGMCDATIVIESGESGGSMITAEFAINYNRDVFAFPGRVGDAASAGCLKLIKTNKAALVESGDDILKAMGWDEASSKGKKAQQKELLIAVTPEEEKIVSSLRDQGNVYIDEICSSSGFGMGKVSSILLMLEFSGVVKSLPGKFYRLQ